MTQDENSLKEWAKRVRTEWKHVPSLKGKGGDTNLIIVRMLAVSKTPKSAWDLALEYLKRTESKFGFWDENKVYHERQKQNSKMNRRLSFLAQRKYVKKIGSLYTLTLKGAYLITSVEPKILAVMPEAALNQEVVDTEGLEPDWNQVPTKVRELLGPPSIETVKAVGAQLASNKLKNELHAITAKKILLSLKINLDEIEPKELFALLSSRS
jgi:hypothetical protein